MSFHEDFLIINLGRSCGDSELDDKLRLNPRLQISYQDCGNVKQE